MSKTLIFTSTDTLFNLNSTNTTKAFEIFDGSIEKIDFVPKKIDFADKKSNSTFIEYCIKKCKRNDSKKKSE